MLRLSFEDMKPQIRRLLVVGAHSDDIEIGCGGTLLSLLSNNTGLQVVWVVLSAGGDRSDEARASAQAFTADHEAVIEVAPFKDGYLPYQAEPVKDFFADLGRRHEPDLILAPHRHDAHQDHRFTSELAYQTFRDHLIMEYEIPKYDGDLGNPNVYVQLPSDIAERKVSLILQHFTSQGDKHWFSGDLFRSMLRIRGMESRAPDGLAEGFFCRKLVIG